MTSRKPAILRGLDLVLISYGAGFSFEWHDSRGRVVCSGWVPGARDAVRLAAFEALVHACGPAPSPGGVSQAPGL